MRYLVGPTGPPLESLLGRPGNASSGSAEGINRPACDRGPIDLMRMTVREYRCVDYKT